MSDSIPVAAEWVNVLASHAARTDRLRHTEVAPPRPARTAPWPDWVPAEVVAQLHAVGITELWSHQAAAAELAYAGTHTVLATGTASGKSLAFRLPVLATIHERRGVRGERGATALYISPTKALAADQMSALNELGLPVRVSTHDGDSSREQREWTRAHAEYVLTNPDMLHHSLLPRHEYWADFFRHLEYVVVDECHHYRGIFGAHTAHVLRRLRRICARYGATPTFILASATIAQPAAVASRLVGEPVRAITDDGAPYGERTVMLWEPPLSGAGGENGAPVRRAASAETSDLVADLVTAGARTLAFVRSRSGVEFIAQRTAELLAEVDASLPARMAAYRGGYLPEERRELEAQLRSGQLLGLAATNALELGIDISGLDAVVVGGYPGTRAALWQQWGRAGRAQGASLGVLVARDDPLDTYLVNHPEVLLGEPVETVVYDTNNPHVLGPQLCAAAAEIPLTEPDLELFGDAAPAVVDELVDRGLLRVRPRGWFYTDRSRASDMADLRSTGGGTVNLLEADTGRVVGTVDTGRAHSTAHSGAVYLHRGETWLVEHLDLDEHVAQLTRTDPGYTTTAREVTDISIADTIEGQRGRATALGRGCSLHFGSVDVTHQVTSFLKRRQPGGEVMGEEPLDLPRRTLQTAAVWWIVPDHELDAVRRVTDDVAGAAHAAEHCSIGLLPLVATCDRWDIGGVSTARHPDTGELTVFVYDGHPGGAGFSEQGYRAARTWLAATRNVIAQCECIDGCPSCIQSPKCGNQNNPLSKPGAIALLDVFLASFGWTPG